MWDYRDVGEDREKMKDYNVLFEKIESRIALNSEPIYSNSHWADYLKRLENIKNNQDGQSEINWKKTFVYIDADRNMIKSLDMDDQVQLFAMCHEIYKNYNSEDFKNRYLVSMNPALLPKILSQCTILILTANKVEKAMLHSYVGLRLKRKIITILHNETGYYIFKLGKYWVAHIHQLEKGSKTKGGSASTISNALENFTPNLIISMGVSFGIDPINQKLGDVIVSKRILPYDINKRDEDVLKPDRSQDTTIEDWLQVRLEHAHSFINKVTYGDVLSGESVLSSSEEKARILLGYTKSDTIVGGEMEGTALFNKEITRGIPGIIIKGICDWGVVKNGHSDGSDSHLKDVERNKDSIQAFAMVNAIISSRPLFEDKYLFWEPKNENIKGLKRIALSSNIIAMFAISILLLSGLLEIFNRFIDSYAFDLYKFLDNPYFKVCTALVLIISCIICSEKWRLGRINRYDIEKQLRKTMIDNERDKEDIEI